MNTAIIRNNSQPERRFGGCAGKEKYLSLDAVQPAIACKNCQARAACVASKFAVEEFTFPPGMRTSGALCQGTVLYRMGEPAKRLFHVRSGMFKTITLKASGDEFVTGFHLPGEVIGRAGADGCYTESAVALDASTVCRLDLDTFLRNQGAHGDFVGAIVQQLGEQSQADLQHRLLLSQTAAGSRFAAFCLNYAQRLSTIGRCKHFLPTPMSRTDMANHLGMTLESLSRVVSKLQARGVILARRDHINIRNFSALQQLAADATL